MPVIALGCGTSAHGKSEEPLLVSTACCAGKGQPTRHASCVRTVLVSRLWHTTGLPSLHQMQAYWQEGRP